MILFSDFDLTIYPSKFKTNIKAINKFVENDNIFIIATGRPYFSIIKHIKKIKYKYLIVNDGAKIYDENNHLIYEQLINDNDKKEILSLAKEKYSKIILDDERTSKIFIRFDNEEDAKIFLDNIKNKYPNLNGYLSRKYINLLPNNISKATAIDYLKNKHNYQNIYVVGDGINDIEMFANYPGISIKTSIEEVRQLAKYHVNEFKDIFKNEEIT